ncbi:site-specific integrase [Pseudoduganella sp. OTU4001]|uniref:site-specific integrase n=1 Tax=Pseudoduganella sp. OTU4001 TaxID=3043854 RepID=UPI00313C26B4
MATFVTTPHGKHKAIIRMAGWPIKTKTFQFKRDAKNWARDTEAEMVRGVYIERSVSEKLTIAKALEQYLAEVTPTKRPATQIAEASKAKALIKELGKYSLAALTPEIIAKYRDKRLAGDLNDDGVRIPRSNDTVRLELALLGHMFTTAIKEWRVGLLINPVLNIRRPAPSPGRTRRLNVAERDNLMTEIAKHSNPMLRWIVGIAIETGMRSSEITSLKLDQVDIARRIVRLVETKNTTSRTVPLTLAATKLFEEALAHAARPKDTSLVFYGEPGRDEVRRPYNFNKIWGDMKKKAGIIDLRFHDLRHEAVSRLVEWGLSDQEVAAISGHKSMQMLRRYTHLRAEDLVGKLDRLQRDV